MNNPEEWKPLTDDEFSNLIWNETFQDVEKAYAELRGRYIKNLATLDNIAPHSST